MEHTSTVWSLAFSPSGAYLALSSDDLSIKIWHRTSVNPETWVCELTISDAHTRTIYSISWGPALDSLPESDTEIGWLASGGGDERIHVWRITGGGSVEHAAVASYESAHGDSDVNSVAWCPREGFRHLLGSAGDDGALRVWEVAKQ